MLPIFLWMMAEGAEFFWHRRGAPGKLIVSGWITLALLSCLEYRFAERHAKDDYRSAAAVAKMALKEGQTVWWDADPNGASYYGVPLSSPSATSGRSAPEAVQISGASSALLEALPRPDFIIASKPDLFDPDGRIERYIESNHYTLEQTLVAFKIFEK
ncbi:MAG TPA: hypothetical protein VMH30_14370, partial [Verrucomicrobiae bacterium]|nr:hypothetical protein [Verrucomicrobiae bacterium]